jgi:hypothetical protein
LRIEAIQSAELNAALENKGQQEERFLVAALLEMTGCHIFSPPLENNLLRRALTPCGAGRSIGLSGSMHVSTEEIASTCAAKEERAA